VGVITVVCFDSLNGNPAEIVKRSLARHASRANRRVCGLLGAPAAEARRGQRGDSVFTEVQGLARRWLVLRGPTRRPQLGGCQRPVAIGRPAVDQVVSQEVKAEAKSACSTRALGGRPPCRRTSRHTVE